MLKVLDLKGILDGLLLVEYGTNKYKLQIAQGSEKQLNYDLLKINGYGFSLLLDYNSETDMFMEDCLVTKEYVGDNIKIWSLTGSCVDEIDIFTYKIMEYNNTYYLYVAYDNENKGIEITDYLQELTKKWTLRDILGFYISLDYLIIKDINDYYIYSDFSSLYTKYRDTIILLYTKEGKLQSRYNIELLDFETTEGVILKCIDKYTNTLISIDKLTKRVLKIGE